MSNYANEVNRTENLKSDLSSALYTVNNELYTDNLKSENIIDISRCIRELKNTRKKWAEGTSEVSRWEEIPNTDWHAGEVDLDVTFTPSVVIGNVKRLALNGAYMEDLYVKWGNSIVNTFSWNGDTAVNEATILTNDDIYRVTSHTMIKGLIDWNKLDVNKFYKSKISSRKQYPIMDRNLYKIPQIKLSWIAFE